MSDNMHGPSPVDPFYGIDIRRVRSAQRAQRELIRHGAYTFACPFDTGNLHGPTSDPRGMSSTRDQDIALERLSLQHNGAALQVQLADTPGSIRATALDESGAVYELDPAGHVHYVRGKRYSTGAPDCSCGYCQFCGYGPPQSLFNAPRTMRGQIALGGIE